MRQTGQSPAAGPRTPRPWLAPLRSALIVLGLTVLALLLCFGIISLAGVFGCRVDEGGAHPCVALGIDFGGGLNFLGMILVMFAFFGVPALGFIILALLVVALFQFVVHRFKRAR